MLSRVYGYVTNNNGFWIGWVVLLTASFTITSNHNHFLQELTIFSSTPSSLTAKDLPHSRSSLIPFCIAYVALRRTHRNTSVAQQWIYVNHTENTSCDTGSTVV
jgi:hypothetical protein